LAYTQSELDDIQDRWNLRFPADLVELMRQRRPMFPRSFDWLKSPREEIERVLNWPLNGFWFDVRKNALWWPEWGPKPERESDQLAVLTAVFAKAPKLIPLSSHRYLPETPTGRGNPVFSVHQSDVVHYGSNLADWLVRESVANGDWTELPPLVAKEIPFWSEAVRRNS
jgi:hypothetical protein